MPTGPMGKDPLALAAVLAAVITRAVHIIGYHLGELTALYYWPVLASRKFENAALAILEGSPSSGPYAYASPLYRYLILPFYLTGAGRTGLFIFQSVLGAVTAWLLYLTALRAGSHRYPALGVSVLWSLYAPAVFYELTILPVSMLTLLLLLFAFMQTGGPGSRTPSPVCGLMAGVISGLRPPFIAVILVPAVKWLKARRWKRAAAGLALLTVPLLFLAFQQAGAGGGFYPFPRTTGTNLVLGHSSESSGYGPPVPSLGLVETGRGDIHDVAAEVAAGLGHRTPAEADRYWTATALSWILENPLEELRLITVKLGGFFGAAPFDTYYELGRIGSFNPVLVLFPVPRLLISLLFLSGLLPFLKDGMNRSAVMVPVVIAVAACVLFVHSERYFLPVLPLMLAAAASGLTLLFRLLRRGISGRVVLCLSGLVLLVPSFFHPVPSVPREMFVWSLAVRAYHMEDYELSLELYERTVLHSEPGTVPWVTGHREAARISEALDDPHRAQRHRDILERAGY